MSCSITSDLLHILQHSLGVDKYGDGEQYRNRFVTNPDSEDGKKCVELVKKGYMRDYGPQSLYDGLHCYCVTPSGIDAVAIQSPGRPKISRSKIRYQEYLRSDSGKNFSEWIGATKSNRKNRTKN